MPQSASLPLPLARVAIAVATLWAFRALQSPGIAAASAEVMLLSLTAAAVLLAVAALAPAPAAELGGAAAAVLALGFALPEGPGRGAVILAVLLFSLAVAALRRVALPGPLPVEAAVAGALGVQFLARGSLLVDPGIAPRTLLVLLLLPTFGAIVTWALAAARGARAWIAAGILVAAGGGWRATGVATLVILLGLTVAAQPDRGWRVRLTGLVFAGAAAAGLAGAPPAQLWPVFAAAIAIVLPRPAVAPAAGLIAAATGAAVLLAGYPWLRAEPLRAAAALVSFRPGGVEILSEVGAHGGETTGVAAPRAGSDLELERAAPSYAAAIAPRVASSIAVRSHLSNAVALPTGTPIGMVRLEFVDSPAAVFVVRSGLETGEWAVRRADVAALAVEAPPAWRSSARAGFFAQEYRAVFHLPRARTADRIALELAPELPSDVLWTVHAIELH